MTTHPDRALLPNGPGRVRLAADRFSFTSRTLECIVEPGEIVLTAGLSSRDAAASAIFRLAGATRVVAEGSRILETGVRIVR
jgi:beta-xylosidase